MQASAIGELKQRAAAELALQSGGRPEDAALAFHFAERLPSRLQSATSSPNTITRRCGASFLAASCSCRSTIVFGWPSGVGDARRIRRGGIDRIRIEVRPAPYPGPGALLSRPGAWPREFRVDLVRDALQPCRRSRLRRPETSGKSPADRAALLPRARFGLVVPFVVAESECE